MEYLVYKAQIETDLESDLQVSYIALLDNPAIEKNFLAFKDHKALFAVNEEKRIISGPAMIADLPIYRNDKQLGEYYVVFDKNTIKNIVQKFSAKGYMQNFNLFHDEKQKVEDVTIFNSFVTDNEIGILPPKGFEDIADGSWFISAKVNSDDVWTKVKAGELKGFSVEGLFNYVPVAKVQMSAEQLAAQIERLINNTEIV